MSTIGCFRAIVCRNSFAWFAIAHLNIPETRTGIVPYTRGPSKPSANQTSIDGDDHCVRSNGASVAAGLGTLHSTRTLPTEIVANEGIGVMVANGEIVEISVVMVGIAVIVANGANAVILAKSERLEAI